MFKKKLSFQLVLPEVRPFTAGPDPDEVHVPLNGHTVTVKKKDEVYKNTAIAVHPEEKRGNAHSPIDGVVTNITPQYISISKQEVTNPVAPRPLPTPLAGLEGEELGKVLKSLGLGRRNLKKEGDHVIINCLNPEPGIYWSGPMLLKHLEELKAGLVLVRRLLRPSQISVALPQHKDLDVDFGPDVRHFYIKPEYPNSMQAMVIKAVTQKEHADGVSVMGMHLLWLYGQVATSGLPPTNTVITVQGQNLRVVPGTPIRALLAAVNIFPKDGDYVILGGYMRGKAVADLDYPVASYNYGVFHVPADDYAPVRENPCINCGACVLYCPSHLIPSKISRYAQFQNYEECRKLSVEACMDCGMCSFVCPARRPMLQYMRESCKQIELQKVEQLPMADI